MSALVFRAHVGRTIARRDAIVNAALSLAKAHRKVVASGVVTAAAEQEVDDAERVLLALCDAYEWSNGGVS